MSDRYVHCACRGCYDWAEGTWGRAACPGCTEAGCNVDVACRRRQAVPEGSGRTSPVSGSCETSSACVSMG
jgi:hypothetical protein